MVGLELIGAVEGGVAGFKIMQETDAECRQSPRFHLSKDLPRFLRRAFSAYPAGGF